MANDHQHGSYYVPEASGWPILAALALFLLGLGSVEYFADARTGSHILLAGIIILALIIMGWLRSVIHESQKGLYDAQMHRTFLWGAGWTLFTDFMLFFALLGALWYCRLFNIPQLSGDYPRMLTHFLLWPDFVNQWPVLVNPDPTQFSSPQQGLHFSWQAIISTILIVCSSFSFHFAYRGLMQGKSLSLRSGLSFTFILSLIFIALTSQTLYLAITRFGLTLSSGIYGSIVLFTIGIYLLHLVVASLLLLVVMIRAAKGHFSATNNFSVRALLWLWYLLTLVWLMVFLSVY